jgi:hypothetical protein
VTLSFFLHVFLPLLWAQNPLHEIPERCDFHSIVNIDPGDAPEKNILIQSFIFMGSLRERELLQEFEVPW